MPYVSINGNMYAMVGKADVIGLRLSKDDMAAFVAKRWPSPFEGTPGFVSKDYVAVPPDMLTDAKALKRWFKLEPRARDEAEAQENDALRRASSSVRPQRRRTVPPAATGAGARSHAWSRPRGSPPRKS